MAKTSFFQGLTAVFAAQICGHYSARTIYCRWLSGILLLFTCQVSATENCQDTRQLQWLQGTWQQDSSNKTTQETWTAVSDKTMQGVTTTKKKSENSTYEEHLLIAQMLDGIYYIAMVPENKQPVPFKAIVCNDSQVIFENPSHDFPQRFNYQRSIDELRIRVENLAGEGFELLLEKH